MPIDKKTILRREGVSNDRIIDVKRSEVSVVTINLNLVKRACKSGKLSFHVFRKVLTETALNICKPMDDLPI